MQYLRIFLSTAILLIFTISQGLSAAEYGKRDNKERVRNEHLSNHPSNRKHKIYTSHNQRHYAQNTKNLHHHHQRHKSSKHRNYYPLGYFVSGAIVGSLLHNNSHTHHSHTRIPSPHISFWRDRYGDCFRVESYRGREYFIAVGSRFCR